MEKTDKEKKTKRKKLKTKIIARLENSLHNDKMYNKIVISKMFFISF